MQCELPGLAQPLLSPCASYQLPDLPRGLLGVMEGRRETRIPRPGGPGAFKSALQPLAEQVPQPSRRGAAPRSWPLSSSGVTRPTPAFHTPAPTLPAQENIGAGVLQERKRKMSPPATAPAAKRAAPATAPSGVAAPPKDAVWEQIAEETGWSVTDCLAHKVTFAKRADAKAKVEPLVAHVKRLRAAGWYLHDQKERWVAPPRKSRGRGRRAVWSVCRSGDWP